MRKLLGWNTLWPIPFFIGLAAGQLLRLELVPGSTGAVAALDLAIGFAVLGYLIRFLWQRRFTEFCRTIINHPVWRWSMLFVGWAAVALLLNAFEYSFSELVVAKAYLVRLASVFVLAWCVAYDPPPRGYLVNGFVLAGSVLLVLGLLQYLLVPDFRFMVQDGWDPHVGRLLSTFFDPNYFGVFLVLLMAVFLARALGTTGRAKLAHWLLFVAAWTALYATISRSAWLAGLIAVPAIAFRRDWRLGVLFVVIFVGILFVPSRLSQRFQATSGLAQPQSFQQQTYRCDESAPDAKCDTSGAQRILSYQRGLELAQDSWLTGVGYNAYGYALVNRGIVSPERLGSRSGQGSDSSLLTILATTGIIGLGFFLAFLASALSGLWVRRKKWIAVALASFTVSWLAVSFFNNAMLYLSILAPWLVLLADTLRPDRKAAR